MKPRTLTVVFLFAAVSVSLSLAQTTATKPRVDFATYLSGNVSTQIDAVAVDATGHLYVTGRTGAADFPTTSGAYLRTPSSPSQSVGRVSALPRSSRFASRSHCATADNAW